MLVLNTKNIEFIPTKELEKEKPVTFILKLPTFETSLKIQRILMENVSTNEGGELTIDNLKIDSVKLIKTVLLDCVVDWRNVYYIDTDGKEKELPFSKENFMYLNDLEVILEIYHKLNELATPPNKTEKKLD